MNITDKISQQVTAILSELTGNPVAESLITFQETRREFAGDITLVTFPLTKLGLGKPEEIGAKVGEALKARMSEVRDYNVVKGFLNIEFSDAYWLERLGEIAKPGFATLDMGKGKKVSIEFSSPNTNKPLHMGHLRNNFLGSSLCNIMEAAGYDVTRTCLVNDRGIAICKSMLMYQKYGNGDTPESTGKKADHFVVDYYVRFGRENKVQAAQVAAEKGISAEDAEMQTPLIAEAREMLLRWEAGDAETMRLWTQMNNWVYEGFEATYKRIGVAFDKIYYESKTWVLGNDIVNEGLAKGVFYQIEDGSVWVDLTAEGLDKKVLRRSDGTSLYMSQDLGTASLRNEELKSEKSVYVVGNEQEYHFKVLFLILKKLGRSWAEGLHHLSYGMVELPKGQGRIKTRDGDGADADNVIDGVVQAASEVTAELGKTEGMSEEEKDLLYEQIGMAALKYMILKVQPVKRMIFDPKESVDLHGNTGAFLLYSYTRTRSLMRVAQERKIIPGEIKYTTPEHSERELIKTLSRYPEVLKAAADNYDPSEIANYLYEVTKNFNRFYVDVKVLNEGDPDTTAFRLHLSTVTGTLLKKGLDLLGIEVPERM